MNKLKHILWLVLPLAIALSAWVAESKKPESVTKPVWQSVRVTKVLDGDTIEVQSGAKRQKIRLIGVNTPETVDPRRPVQCFGREASAFAKQQLPPGAKISLEVDASQGDKDKYGRYLRYVRLADGSLFNQRLLAEGYAYEYTYQTPYRYQAEFKQAQAQAKAELKGLWADGACGQRNLTAASSSATSTKANKAGAADSQAVEPAVKKSRAGICHQAGRSPYYQETKQFSAYDSLKACLDSGGRLPK